MSATAYNKGAYTKPEAYIGFRCVAEIKIKAKSDFKGTKTTIGRAKKQPSAGQKSHCRGWKYIFYFLSI